MKQENILSITNEHLGLRLDRFLQQKFPLVPYTAWAKMMRKGNVRLNGGRVKGAEVLSINDQIRIPPTSVLDSYQNDRPLKKPPQAVTEKDITLFQSFILKDTPDVLFINKPPGLATQGGTNIKISVDDLAKAYAQKNNIQLKLVHRLDKDTSGLLMLAKNEKTARRIGRLLKEKKIQKYYLAITKGVPMPHEGIIKAPLEKVEGKSKEMMEVTEKGKKSETHYTVLDNFGKVLSTLLVEPKTGRTHQIRCHMSYLETPILGDHKYGDGNDHGSTGLCLHALTIRMEKFHDIPTCPLPKHLKDLFKNLGINESNTLQQAKIKVTQGTSA